MSVGWDVKLCARINDNNLLGTRMISMRRRLVRAARETSKFHKWSPFIIVAAVICLKYCSYDIKPYVQSIIMLSGDHGFFSFFINLIIAFHNGAFWLELFLRWAMWPMGLWLSILNRWVKSSEHEPWNSLVLFLVAQWTGLVDGQKMLWLLCLDIFWTIII